MISARSAHLPTILDTLTGKARKFCEAHDERILNEGEERGWE
jgi:hypothetical protein